LKTGSAKAVRCAIYTRVSTDQKLEQDFNSLDAQYDASQAYIRSQAHAGWTLLRGKYDDGGFSGGDTDRPALQRLLEDVRAGKIDVIVVYKVDRLTRSLSASRRECAAQGRSAQIASAHTQRRKSWQQIRIRMDKQRLPCCCTLGAYHAGAFIC
jgi:hypothetical protein